MNQSSDFNAVMHAIGFAEPPPAWAKVWPESQALFNQDALYFLQPRWIEEALKKLNFPETIRDAFRKARPFFIQSPARQRLAWHCCHQFSRTAFDPANLKAWPVLPESLGADGAMFYAFICLAGLPQIELKHRRRGIEPAITYDTMADFALWMEHYRRQYGVWGLSNTILTWAYGYLSDRLIKLGRLQFSRPSEFPYDFHVYRHRQDQRILMLAGDGMQFRPDGQFDGANGISAGANAWTSRWITAAAEISGNLITQSGTAQRETVVLPSGEWAEVLGRKSMVCAVHIPAAGPLTREACRESLQRARAFLPAHYPEDSFCAFTCVSWLMDNQFDRFLPASSNILQFQREFHLYPIPGASDAQTYERVFGRPDIKIDEAPQTTSLQRILAAHVKAGGRWHDGGGFIPRDSAGIYR